MTWARLETKSWPSTSTPSLAQAGDLVEESDGVQHHAVADDAFAARAQHAAGDELQDELLAADDDGMPGVMPAGIARHRGEPLAQHVHNFAFALVAPLGAQHYCRLCSHVFRIPVRLARRSLKGRRRGQ